MYHATPYHPSCHPPYQPTRHRSQGRLLHRQRRREGQPLRDPTFRRQGGAVCAPPTHTHTRPVLSSPSIPSAPLSVLVAATLAAAGACGKNLPPILTPPSPCLYFRVAPMCMCMTLFGARPMQCRMRSSEGAAVVVRGEQRTARRGALHLYPARSCPHDPPAPPENPGPGVFFCRNPDPRLFSGHPTPAAVQSKCCRPVRAAASMWMVDRRSLHGSRSVPLTRSKPSLGLTCFLAVVHSPISSPSTRYSTTRTQGLRSSRTAPRSVRVSFGRAPSLSDTPFHTSHTEWTATYQSVPHWNTIVLRQVLTLVL